MEARKTSVFIATKTPVEISFTILDTDVSFPSEWFQRNPGQKPSTAIGKCKSSYPDLLRAVIGGISGSNLSVDTAKVFLHRFGLQMGAVLDAEWVSFNIRIGAYGETITPWNIVEVIEGALYAPTEVMPPMVGPGALVAPGDPSTWTDISCCMYILCVYRLCKVNNEEYYDLLAKRMIEQITAEGGRNMSFHGIIGIYGSWLNDTGFLKMVAAYDMFLHRFRDHKNGVLRIGSLSSRFRDCAGLMSFGYALSILNIGSGELMEWAFVTPLAYELLQIAHPGQESGSKESYFPYQSDMGLVMKSAYSSTANPYLFF